MAVPGQPRVRPRAARGCPGCGRWPATAAPHRGYAGVFPPCADCEPMTWALRHTNVSRSIYILYAHRASANRQHATGQHTNVLARRLLYKGKLPSDDGIIAANLMPFSTLTTPAPCRKFQLTFVRHLRCILTGYASPPFPVTVERLDPADARKK